jgi:hypothetical protein
MKRRLSGPAGLFAATIASAALVAACSSSSQQALGSQSSNPALRGTTTVGQVFPGGPLQEIVTIKASALKAGGVYAAPVGDSLTVVGNPQKDVTLIVNDAKLKLEGTAGFGDFLVVFAPVVTQTTTYSCYTYGLTPSGQFGLVFVFNGCSDTNTLGLRYNDPGSALIVTGSAIPGQLSTNAGISVGGKPIKNPKQLGVAPA